MDCVAHHARLDRQNLHSLNTLSSGVLEWTHTPSSRSNGSPTPFTHVRSKILLDDLYSNCSVCPVAM